jgi:hypothetical protein
VSYAADVLKAQGWEDADGGAYVVRGDALVPATDEALREIAHSFTLLSQGAERAIELRQQERGLTRLHG